jgi:hypothetical protein
LRQNDAPGKRLEIKAFRAFDAVMEVDREGAIWYRTNNERACLNEGFRQERETG